jgi:hypothetical protein
LADPINKNQFWLNAFICDEGQFAWTRTLFGLKGFASFINLRRHLHQPPTPEKTDNSKDIIYARSAENHQPGQLSPPTYTCSWSRHLQPLMVFVARVVYSMPNNLDTHTMTKRT